MDNAFQYRAYGNIMLFGEYAVIHQGFGICSAIDQFITASLKLRTDSKIMVQTQLGDLEGSLECFPQSEKLNYLCAAIEVCRDLMKTGIDLSLDSTIDVFVGFGSSAATLASIVGVICKAHGESDEDVIIQRTLNALKLVSPLASGCDCVASVVGGTVAFNPRTKEKIQYRNSFDITALYSGSKAISIEEISKLEEKRKADPVKIAKLYQSINKITQLAMHALVNNDLHRLGELMTMHHHDQLALGTSTPVLDRLIEILNDEPNILGAKISGAGGGDCVIGLGNTFIQLPIDLDRARVFHLKTLPGRSVSR